MIGQTLHSRYTITAHIGSGAMGTVYRAADSQTGEEVAVRLLNRELAFSPELLERFRREGEALRQLRHPNIVGLVDVFQHDPDPSGGAGGQQVIVMEYVAGGSLHGLIKQGPLPADRARTIALGLCDALTRAHDLGIIHRDIKPENILVAADGTPKLTDFGIARLLTEGTRITHSGIQVGTPYYMSPEAWEGKPLDAQADIWSLGVVLFEMLSGEVPFPGETVIAVMHKVLTAPLPELKQTRPDAPEGLAQIVRRMMARDKAARYQTMREVGLDLERGEPMAVPVQPLAQPARRISAWVWATAGGVIFVVVITLAVAGSGFLGPLARSNGQPATEMLVTPIAIATIKPTIVVPTATSASSSTSTQTATTTLKPTPEWVVYDDFEQSTQTLRLLLWGGGALFRVENGMAVASVPKGQAFIGSQAFPTTPSQWRPAPSGKTRLAFGARLSVGESISKVQRGSAGSSLTISSSVYFFAIGYQFRSSLSYYCDAGGGSPRNLYLYNREMGTPGFNDWHYFELAIVEGEESTSFAIEGYVDNEFACRYVPPSDWQMALITFPVSMSIGVWWPEDSWDAEEPLLAFFDDVAVGFGGATP